jgi:hypothetical protein
MAGSRLLNPIAGWGKVLLEQQVVQEGFSDQTILAADQVLPCWSARKAARSRLAGEQVPPVPARMSASRNCVYKQAWPVVEWEWVFLSVVMCAMKGPVLCAGLPGEPPQGQIQHACAPVRSKGRLFDGCHNNGPLSSIPAIFLPLQSTGPTDQDPAGILVSGARL